MKNKKCWRGREAKKELKRIYKKKLKCDTHHFDSKK
jgi:hypothetical protein